MRFFCVPIALLLFISTSSKGQFKRINLPTANAASISTMNPESVVFKNKLYFIASNATYGEEIYVTDGTPGNTELFIDLEPGGSDGYVSLLTPAGDKLFFSGYSDLGGIATRQLYVSDGTAAGTHGISPLVPTVIFPSFKCVSLQDMLGRDAITLPITTENTTIDVGHLSRGMYIVRVTGTDQNIVTRKIILR